MSKSSRRRRREKQRMAQSNAPQVHQTVSEKIRQLFSKDVAPAHVPVQSCTITSQVPHPPTVTVSPVTEPWRPTYPTLPYVAPPKKTVKEHVMAQVRGASMFPRYSNEALMQAEGVPELLNMLTYMRPAGSDAEEEFIAKYITPWGSTRDGYGNRWIRVNHPDGSAPDILFSAHTDTVHRQEGKQVIELADGLVFAENSNCLGADDTCGVWLMVQMIKAKVPGLYIFHREEEVGGHGSKWVTTNHKGKIKGIKAAIAFDRKAYSSIITHQRGGRCCSETFSASLSAILGGGFKSDSTGTFTDTANYIDLVGECTNLSVGYFSQHGPTEHTDVSFLLGLRDALIAADWSKLEFERKPGEREARSSYADMYDAYMGYSGNWRSRGGMSATGSHWSGDNEIDADDDPSLDEHEATAEEIKAMDEYVRRYPDVVSMWLLANGITEEEIDDFYYMDMGLGADDDDPKPVDEEITH